MDEQQAIEPCGYLVAHGSAFNGDLCIFGPFPTQEDAIEWAEKQRQDRWEVVPLYTPE